jgi:glycosyltransferase involved in cell wall biosynthesis
MGQSRTELIPFYEPCPEIHDIPLAPLQMGRAARSLNAWILRRAVHKSLKSDGAPILPEAKSGLESLDPSSLFIVSTLPLTADLVGAVPGATFIYYLVDDYAAWPGLTGKLVRQMDREQARTADRIVAASRTLADLHQEVTDRIDYLPHGVDVDHFAIGRQVRAQRKQNGIKPIAEVIFFGALDERIDQELFNAVVQARPHLRFLCIGPPTGSKDRLIAVPNLERRPPVPFSELPNLLGQCEVALMPYVQTDLGQRLAPLKALEALTAGLPVVSTDIPELRSLPGGAILGKTLDDLVSGLDRASGGSLEPPSLQALSSESWERRAERLSQIMIAAKSAAKRGHSSFCQSSAPAISQQKGAARLRPQRDECPLFPIRILELRSVRGTGGGPEKTILQSAARTDPHRFAVTVCYLRDARDTAFRIDVQASNLNIDYAEIPERHSWDPKIWTALRCLVREKNIDIVHSHEYKSDFLALLLAKFEPVIPIATVHGWTGCTRREEFFYSVDKRLLRGFPRLITVSNQIRQTLVASGVREDRIHTIPNAIDAQVFRRDTARVKSVRDSLGLGPHDFAIGAVGRLEPQKRFDVLLQAFAQIRSRSPDLRLIIVGEGEERANLEHDIRRLGLTDSCRLLGHRTGIVELHHAFDLFVQSSDYEGTPNAVLEAMAMETPIVATDVGGTADLIQNGDHGLLAPPRSPAALARAIEEALDDVESTNKRRAAARLRVEQEFSFDKRLQAVQAIYEQLINESVRNCRQKGR